MGEARPSHCQPRAHTQRVCTESAARRRGGIAQRALPNSRSCRPERDSADGQPFRQHHEYLGAPGLLPAAGGRQSDGRSASARCRRSSRRRRCLEWVIWTPLNRPHLRREPSGIDVGRHHPRIKAGSLCASSARLIPSPEDLGIVLNGAERGLNDTSYYDHYAVRRQRRISRAAPAARVPAARRPATAARR